MLRTVLLMSALTATLIATQTTSYDQVYEHARQLLQQHDYFNALKEFQRANLIARGKSAESMLGQAQALLGMKVFKNALDASQSAIDLAGDDRRVLTRGHKLRGQVFKAIGDLVHAEAELRAALAADPESRIPDVRYELALVLLNERKDDEAIEELKKEIELRPHGTTADEARELIASPHRGREKYAPGFAFDATSGQHISLESLRGKIVLLDFWASWCGPCVRALPAIQKLSKEHANDPFVLLGISGDEDESAWHAFTAKNGMTWPQYWDRDHRLRQAFNIHAIPTYVLLDAEGVERLRIVGSGFDQARSLPAEIDRQIRMK
jgi:thioredoxin-like negative regulator of GroEL